MDDDADFSPTPKTREWSEVVLALGLIAGLVVLLSLKVTDAQQPLSADRGPVEAVLHETVGYVALGAEVCAVLVIAWGVLQALWGGSVHVVRTGGNGMNSTETLRLRLGRVLALGIEFTLAADILQTVVAPTRADILALGAIVLLRTLLNLFLEREIREGEEKRRRLGGEVA